MVRGGSGEGEARARGVQTEVKGRWAASVTTKLLEAVSQKEGRFTWDQGLRVVSWWFRCAALEPVVRQSIMVVAHTGNREAETGRGWSPHIPLKDTFSVM